MISSNFLVNSLVTAALRSPMTSKISLRVRSKRCGDSKSRMVRSSWDKNFNRAFRRPDLVGKKPSKAKRSVGKPETIRAEIRIALEQVQADLASKQKNGGQVNGDKEKTTKNIEGEWSKPMSKVDIMKRLGFGLRGYRKLETYAKEHPIRRVGDSRQLWQIRIDKMPKKNIKGRTKLMVDYYKKYSSAAFPFFILFLSIPFGIAHIKEASSKSIGIGVLFSLAYYFIDTIFYEAGKGMLISPLSSAWEKSCWALTCSGPA